MPSNGKIDCGALEEYVVLKKAGKKKNTLVQYIISFPSSTFFDKLSFADLLFVPNFSLHIINI